MFAVDIGHPEWPMSSAQLIEQSRQKFADLAVTTALQCSARELVPRLCNLLPAGFLELAGKGSTRIVYATPLGVCLKVQRDPVFDPLTDAELKARGGADYLPTLVMLRKIANVAELGFATKHPTLMPTIYGFVANFGHVQRHASVLIAETVRPLDTYDSETRWIARSDISVDENGSLRISGKGIKKCERSEDYMWAGNLGVNSERRYVLLDGSNFDVWDFINPWTMCPASWGLSLGDTEKDRQYSESAFEAYCKAAKT